MDFLGLGPVELIIILVIVLVLFGPKRLPELAKSLGKTMKSVRDGLEGKDDVEEAAPAAESSVLTQADEVDATVAADEAQPEE